MAALVAALIVQVGDRTVATSAMLGSRHADTFGVVLGMALALALTNGVGAIGGALLSPYLDSSARDVFVALALISAGISGFGRISPRTIPARIGAFPGAFLAIGVLAVGDRTQFITAALAARSATPVLPAIGAIIGAVAVNTFAVMLGEQGLRRVPLRAMRLGAATLLTLVGTFQGLSAVGLI